jgi:hypothetical protein
MAKYNTTITKKDGSKASGYIEDGKSYYDNGTAISAGDSVVDAQGKTWTKGGDTSSNASSEVAMINNAIRANNAGIKKAIDTEKVRRQSTYTAGDNIDALASLQKQMKQQELQRARANALSSLNAEQIATNQAYENKINKENTNSDILLKNYFENVANRGQTYSGSTSQGEIAHNIARQNNISALQQAQAAALADIARRKQLAEQGYIDDMQSASNAIDLKVLENRISNEQNAGTEALKKAQLMAELGDYSGLQALGYNTSVIEEQNKAKATANEAEQALNRAKLMAEMGDFSGLKGLGYDTTGLEKQWALDMANTQSLINSRNNNGGTGGGSGEDTKKGGSKNYTDILETTKGYTSLGLYADNMEGAKYVLGEADLGNLTIEETMNIIRQANIPIEVVARAMKKYYGFTDEDVIDTVKKYFNDKISDDYLKKITDYANAKEWVDPKKAE